mmetsp:Transcript_93082/g.265814  ORF Transcript_93082/g.265814 Transcript_93082/m.265814 type:complete len:368 (-) Transcript_93082:214-1317(-)
MPLQLCHYLYWNFVRTRCIEAIAAFNANNLSDNVSISDTTLGTAGGGGAGNGPTEGSVAESLRSLGPDEKERLFLEMTRHLQTLITKLRSSKMGLNASMPCLLVSLRTAVDRVFCSGYRWFRVKVKGEHTEEATELLTDMQYEVTRLLDPDLYFSHIKSLGANRPVQLTYRPDSRAVLSPGSEAQPPANTTALHEGRQHTQRRPASTAGSGRRRVRDSYHTTSAAVRTLFANPTSAGARRMLQLQEEGSNATAGATRSGRRAQSVPGATNVFEPDQTSEREQLRDSNTAALYESTLAKTRHRYIQEYSRCRNRALLEREVMLEPITSGMVSAHRADLERFQSEVVDLKHIAQAGLLNHPTDFHVTRY